MKTGLGQTLALAFLAGSLLLSPLSALDADAAARPQAKPAAAAKASTQKFDLSAIDITTIKTIEDLDRVDASLKQYKKDLVDGYLADTIEEDTPEEEAFLDQMEQIDEMQALINDIRSNGGFDATQATAAAESTDAPEWTSSGGSASQPLPQEGTTMFPGAAPQTSQLSPQGEAAANKLFSQNNLKKLRTGLKFLQAARKFTGAGGAGGLLPGGAPAAAGALPGGIPGAAPGAIPGGAPPAGAFANPTPTAPAPTPSTGAAGGSGASPAPNTPLTPDPSAGQTNITGGPDPVPDTTHTTPNPKLDHLVDPAKNSIPLGEGASINDLRQQILSQLPPKPPDECDAGNPQWHLKNDGELINENSSLFTGQSPKGQRKVLRKLRKVESRRLGNFTKHCDAKKKAEAAKNAPPPSANASQPALSEICQQAEKIRQTKIGPNGFVLTRDEVNILNQCEAEKQAMLRGGVSTMAGCIPPEKLNACVDAKILFDRPNKNYTAADLAKMRMCPEAQYMKKP